MKAPRYRSIVLASLLVCFVGTVPISRGADDPLSNPAAPEATAPSWGEQYAMALGLEGNPVAQQLLHYSAAELL